MFLSVSLSLLLTVITAEYVMSLFQNLYMHVINTINQLLLTRTLFRDLPETNWFVATNFRNQALSTSALNFYYNFMADTGPRQKYS